VVGWVVLAPQRLGRPGVILWTLALLAVTVMGRIRIGARLSKHHLAHAQGLLEKAQKREQEAKHERLELAVQGAKDGIWRWDLRSGLFEFSPSWAAMLGYDKKEIEASVNEWFDRIHPGYRQQVERDISIHLHGQSPQFRNVHRLCQKDGTYLWVLARGSLVRDESGVAVALTGTSADVTSLMEAEVRVLNDSFHDKLTGLPNREFLVRSLIQRIEQRNKRRDHLPSFAVMFLDLDRFKAINDSLGHPAGDQLLREVARRLQRCTRPGDVVARFGGDEFVILLGQIVDTEEALAIGSRMRDALATPFQLAGGAVASGASIGVALNTTQIESADELLRHADLAMYQAKNHGKGQVRLFSDDMSSYETKLCELQNDLRLAVARDQLILHYQPCFEVSSGRILGVEALIRWQRSDSEFMLPSEFLPLAEETGLIDEIGEWVLRSACAQNVAWQRAGIPPIKMAVNVSARQLQHKEFSRTVGRVLEETNHEAHWLELELTESALVGALDHAPKTLERLGALGVRIAIDDFGTGYSSLNYLRQFSVSTLKMDRCFVMDVVTDERAGAVAKGLIALGHNLDLPVIAEGVELNSQLSFLAAHRCDQAQGFLAGPAVRAENLVGLLETGEVKQAFRSDFDSIVNLDRLACLFDDHKPAPQHAKHYLQRG
jgi:diguanylate cyclase (GGDEF)-like protein/PAS domain S-box-containing protein